MARRKKTYDDDDGRTIADMSGVAPQPLLIPGRSSGGRKPAPPADPDQAPADRPWEEEQDKLSREDRRLYILGALKAALLIALVFILGLGLAIVLLALLWK